MDASEHTKYLWTETAEDGSELRVSGELDAGSSQELLDAVETRVQAGGDVVLDLSALSFIDSSGVRAIAETLRRSDSEGFGFRISSASAAVVRVLEMTGMATLIDS